jgi:hypothetical protein
MRKFLLAGTALGCLLSAEPASAGLLSNILKPVTSMVTTTVSTVLPANGLVLDAPANPNDPKINPFYGNINPFYGSINPFYGSINPFYGSISPFWGDISPFYGNINPFYGSISPFYGNINPFWGTINPFDTSIGPFWEAAGPQWGSINTLWNNLQASNATDYSGLQAQLKQFIADSSAFWSPAVQKYTGKDFNSGFANAVLSTYGINPDDTSSLANVNVMARSAFMLSWYDGLMNFTGVDHVDWWMPSINWSPALTKTENTNGNVTVGILDSTFSGDATGVDNVHFAGGYNYYVNQHGGAVASLIAAQQDGKGVMGIAPNSQIQLYNPFDQTGTTNWQDVTKGINALFQRGASAINASLGTPGWTLSSEWISVLSGSLLSARHNDLVIVKAAGNEGVAQTQNIEWLSNLSNVALSSLLTPIDNLIMVGSVGPTGDISSFSNTPGNACVTVAGLCLEQNKLMYHFVVAPGELILVSDGHGGVTRMSGTSFAAPLVTGAVALLQDRWPWLAQHAPETAQIIFQSAKDLGAPGVDPVYGWGELDVQASQSPLDFDNLVVYQPFTYNGTGTNPLATLVPNWSSRQLKQSVLDAGQLNLWQNQKAYLVALEPIGTTFRDFTIPLSTMLVGKNQKTAYGNNPFQAYLYQRLIDWANGSKFSNFSSQSTALAQSDWNLSLTTTAPLPEEQRRTGIARTHYEVQLINKGDGIDFRVGEGSGAHGLMSGLTSQMANAAFALATDFDPSTGGVNPVLGLASGGAYAQGGLSFGGARVSLGYSEKSDNHVYMDPTYGPLRTVPLATSKASASVVGVDYSLTANFALNASFTALDENNGLLGAQGAGALTLTGGHTNATTIGATMTFDGGWTFAASATSGHTTDASGQSALTIAQGGLHSTAYELVAKKAGLLGDTDELRVSFAQPLHVDSGMLQYRQVEVTNRETGTLGAVTQSWNISGNREHRVEAIYAVPVFDGRAQVSGFGLIDMNPPELNGRSMSLSAGAQIQLNL